MRFSAEIALSFYSVDPLISGEMVGEDKCAVKSHNLDRLASLPDPIADELLFVLSFGSQSL